MISRRQSTIRKTTEQLREASFTANSGINITSPVTERNSVFNTTNFDVALDGSLTLRKPLILADNKTYIDATPILIKHLYLKDYKLYVYKSQQYDTYAIVRPDNPIRPPRPVSKFEKLCLVHDGEQVGIESGIITDINGKEHSFKVPDFLKNGIIDTLNVAIINTPSSTLISGILLDIDYFSKLDLGIKLNENNVVPRYLQLYKNELDVWVLKVITQLPNEIASDTIRLNPNTSLDYPYAIRDNYSSEAVSVSNILAYVHCEKSDGKFVHGDGVNAHGVIRTVEELTENGNVPGYFPVTSVEGNEPYIYLKAFLNIKNTPEISYVCLWEKTFDGVTWVEVPEFISKIKEEDSLTLYVPTDMLQENLNTSEKTIKKTFAKFYVNSQKDLIADRYDILPLPKADGATYRFTIYTLPQVVTYDAINLTYSSVDVDSVWGETEPDTVTGLNNNSLYEGVYYNFDNEAYNIKYYLSFNLTQDFPENVTKDSFSIILVSEDSVEHDVTFTFDSSDSKHIKFKFNTPTTYKIKDGDVISSYQFLIKIFYNQTHYFTLKNLAYVQLSDNDAVTYTPNFVAIVSNHDKFTDNESLPRVPNIQNFLKSSGFYDSCDSNTLYEVNLANIYLYRDHVDLSTYISSTIGDAESSSTYLINSVKRYLIDKQIMLGVSSDEYFEIQDVANRGENVLNTSPIRLLGSLFEHSSSVEYSATRLDVATDTPSSSWIEYTIKTKRIKLPDPFYSVTGNSQLFNIIDEISNAMADIPVTFRYLGSEIFYFLKNSNGEIIIIPKASNGDTFSKTNILSLKALSSEYNINDFDTTFTLESDAPDYTPDVLDSDAYTTLLARAQYAFIKSKLEPLTYEFSNSTLGNKLYYKKSIYSFGDSGFKNNIFVSEVDSFNTPLFNIIDLDASGDSIVTTLIPWRDYLLATTEHSIYLITKVENGFLTKTVNTFIGIPAQDSRTCKSILNGIIFKSGSKIYILQPSMYSGDDTILNISEVSKPINNYIVNSTYDNFAFTTEDAYYLFMPEYSQTTCLKYEYSRKLWTKYVYPVRFINYDILSVNDIRLYTSIGKEYYFNKTLKEVYPDLSKDVLDNIPYGDYIGLTYEDIANFENLDTEGDFRTDRMTPINYYLDSGQKTDAISYTKQFTESKIILATLHQKDKFPFTLTVKIDGKSQPVTVGVHTDSALWKDENADINTLSTDYASDDSDLFNVLRQMFVRYSAKGKSIQHIISGESYFNFKIYVVYYRYKMLNFKQ